MEALRTYLNALTVAEQQKFSSDVGTSIGYLRKAISVGQRLAVPTVIKIEQASGGAVRCEQLRTDIDWAYLRGTASANHAA